MCWKTPKLPVGGFATAAAPPPAQPAADNVDLGKRTGPVFDRSDLINALGFGKRKKPGVSITGAVPNQTLADTVTSRLGFGTGT